MRSTTVPLVLLALAAIATACAGAASSDLYDAPPSGATTGGATPGSTAGATTAGTGTTGSKSTTGGASTTGGNGSTTGAGGTTGGGGGTTGGNGTTIGGATTGSGTTTGGPVTTTYCGNSGASSAGTLECTSPESCCGTYAGSDVVLACERNGCNGGLEITCRDSSDCSGGNVCCGTLQNSKWTRITCAASCGSGGGSSTEKLEMCDPLAPPTSCPAAKPFCRASAQVKGFSYCSATP